MTAIILITIVTVALFAGPRLAAYLGETRALAAVAVLGALLLAL